VALGLLAIPAIPASAGPAPAFEPGRCPEVVPDDPRVECGTLTVPENRRLSAGEVVLSVARIRPLTAEIAEAPLLYVSGGPGDASLAYAIDHLEHPIVEDRELVLVDLRGTGESLPSLACPEAESGPFSFAAPSDDRAAQRAALDAIGDCKRRLEADGVDLRAYDYEEMATDLADLRVALGIAEWDVYGISNGGRLALELVRRHPEGVRSLVLDAALAPQGNFFTELWPHAARAFDVLFGACTADPGCNAAHPDLEDRFWDLIERLREEPVVQSGTRPDGETGRVVFDDRNALDILRAGLYDTSLLPIIPALLDQLTSGVGFDVVAAEVLASAGSTETFSLGENLSDNCREEVAYVRSAELERQARKLPRFRRVILHDTYRRECEVWDVGKADAAVNRPVRSKLPALLLVGEYDPVHPITSSRKIAKHLPNSTVVEFPGIGHGTVFAHDCPRTVLRAFVLDPDGPLDTGCVEQMGPPAFG
jgi:pimeloyl-ACP methyl ester carboxylesterase